MVDFPKYKKLPKTQMPKNQELKQKFNISGIPMVLLVDHKEEVILKTNYRCGGAKSFVELLGEFLGPKEKYGQ